MPAKEFTKVNDSLEEQTRKAAQAEAQMGMLKEKLAQSTREVEAAKQDKKKFLMESINAKQEVEDVKRDLELKDVKIESLQNIIKKRGFDEAKGPATRPEDQQKIH